MIQSRSPIVARRGDRLVGYAFVLPAVALLAVFVVWPFLNTARLAFYTVDRRGRIGRFVGWEHISSVLGSNELRSSLKATVAFVALTAPIGVVAALGLAVIAQRPIRGRAFFRTVFSSTIVTSGALSAALFIDLLAPTTGIVRYASSFSPRSLAAEERESTSTIRQGLRRISSTGSRYSSSPHPTATSG